MLFYSSSSHLAPFVFYCIRSLPAVANSNIYGNRDGSRNASGVVKAADSNRGTDVGWCPFFSASHFGSCSHIVVAAYSSPTSAAMTTTAVAGASIAVTKQQHRLDGSGNTEVSVCAFLSFTSFIMTCPKRIVSM